MINNIRIVRMMIARKIQTLLSHVKGDSRILASNYLCSNTCSQNVLQNDRVQELPRDFMPSTNYTLINKYVYSVPARVTLNERNASSKHVSAVYIGTTKNILHCGSGTILTRTNSNMLNYNGARQLSSESINTFGTFGAMCSESKAVELAQNTLLWLQSTTGLPWWLSVVVTTVILRTVVTLPLAIHQLVIVAKVDRMNKEMVTIAPMLRKEVESEAKMKKLTPRQAKLKYLLACKEKRTEIIIRDNCHPAKVSILMIVQIPMWVMLSFSLRNLVAMAPKYDIDALLIYLNISEGGIGWIHDLIATDPYYILPVLLGILNLYIIETQVMLKKVPNTRIQKCVTFLMRAVSVVMIFIAANVPSLLSLYWTTSSAYGLIQRLVLVSPRVRRSLGIPESSFDHEHPYRTLWIKTLQRLGMKEKPEVAVTGK